MGKPKKYEERLMQALGYDEDDLEANRAGHFSEAQRTQFAAEQRQSWLVAAFVILLFLGWIGAAQINSTAAASLPLIFLLLPVFGGVFLKYAIMALRLRADAQEDQAESTEGRVDLAMRGTTTNRVVCTLRVADKRFSVKQDAFLAMKNGDPYHVYYALRSKRLLSVEWLRENDDNLLPVTDFVTNGKADDEADAEIGDMNQQQLSK